MMPYLQNRVVSIKRCPQGTNQTCFFERNHHYEHEGIQPVKMKSDDDEQSTYFSIDAVSGLLYLAQLNTIEFHIWGSKASTIDFPDIMVFDLDPDEKMSLDQVRQGVKDLKNILDKLSLTSFLKTSGGKGYHVVLPFTSKQSWDKFFAFAKNVALLMEQTFPDKYTTNIRKQSRKNKIFIDFLRNKKSATSVAPYSVRAKAKATVSMPISWRELSTVAPDAITILEALERRKKADPWKAFFSTKQELV